LIVCISEKVVKRFLSLALYQDLYSLP